MLNENFKKVATIVRGLEKKGKGVFGALQTFVIEAGSNGVEALKDALKAQEKLANTEMKMEMQKNSTYKVAKSVLVRAVEANIALVGADGKPRGKTDIEADLDALAAAEPEKTDFEKFQAAMNTATQLAGKVSDEDCAIAAGLVSTLYKTLADRIPVKAAA